jgi:hypothetical protein
MQSGCPSGGVVSEGVGLVHITASFLLFYVFTSKADCSIHHARLGDKLIIPSGDFIRQAATHLRKR